MRKIPEVSLDFTGDICGKCNILVNVLHDAGWHCACGHWNVLPHTTRRIPHEAPQMGPTRQQITNLRRGVE